MLDQRERGAGRLALAAYAHRLGVVSERMLPACPKCPAAVGIKYFSRFAGETRMPSSRAVRRDSLLRLTSGSPVHLGTTPASS